MAPTRTIAGLLGPLAAAIGLSLVVRRESFVVMVNQLDAGVIYLTGIIMLLGGLAIVRTHNLWVLRWPVIVTVLGWLAIAGGLARMLFPRSVAEMAFIAVDNAVVLTVGGGLLLTLGLFLSFMSLRDGADPFSVRMLPNEPPR